MRREHFFHVNGGENRVLRVYLSRSRTCSFFIAVLMGTRTRPVRQYPSRSDANRSKPGNAERPEVHASGFHSECDYIAIATDGHAGA